MEGCIAPSEVPGISPADASTFGKMAEELIYMDFCAQHLYSVTEIYKDDHNPYSYAYFLQSKNPFLSLTKFTGLMRGLPEGIVRPDILVHSFIKKEFYEIKPDSISGRRDGTNKVNTLWFTYIDFKLPYNPGVTYKPNDITVATFVSQMTVKLKTQRISPGLLVYKLCINSNGMLELATLAALLRYIIKKMNEQRGSRTFRPVDLRPAFAREGELSGLAKALRLVMATGVAAVGWKYFWKAVAKRFAVRGAAALALSVADGPLPVGELLSLGLALWTVVDIIRFSSELWSDAAVIARQEA